VEATTITLLQCMYFRETESRWVKSIQRHSFAEEFQRLLSGESVSHKGQLILYLYDDFVTCCWGHLNQADLPSSIRNPILLPNKHSFTELLVQSKHFAVHHATLAAVRENYWIVKGHSLVRKIICRYTVCRQHDYLPQHFCKLLDALQAERPSQGHNADNAKPFKFKHCSHEIMKIRKFAITLLTNRWSGNSLWRRLLGWEDIGSVQYKVLNTALKKTIGRATLT